MAKTREIKGRIKAVGNIQRITKTMQMIATARFQAAQRRAVAAQPYTKKIAEMVSELASTLAADAAAKGKSDAGVDHPLLRPATGEGKRLLLVITSNRGLCGGYNASILRAAVSFIRQSVGSGTDVEVVGKKGLGYLKFQNVPVQEFHSQFTDKPEFSTVHALAQKYMDAFAIGQYDSVNVAFMSFASISRQTAIVQQLLPLQNPTASGKAPANSAQYDFSPEPAKLLAELLPVTVKTQLFQAFNEANVSEHIARMVAMKSATDNASKMKKTLTRKYNRARQAAITTELSEIVAGAAALG